MVCDALFRYHLADLRFQVRLSMLDLSVGYCIAFTQAAR